MHTKVITTCFRARELSISSTIMIIAGLGVSSNKHFVGAAITAFSYHSFVGSNNCEPRYLKLLLRCGNVLNIARYDTSPRLQYFTLIYGYFTPDLIYFPFVAGASEFHAREYIWLLRTYATPTPLESEAAKETVLHLLFAVSFSSTGQI